MTTRMTGTSAIGMPRFCARNIRKASLNRASVSTAAIATTSQNAIENRRASAKRGRTRSCPSLGRAGSFTANTINANDTKAGITAIQNTSVKLFSVSAIRPMAASGPAKAPTVSSDCRRPNARTANGLRRQIGDQRVTRRAADPLADAVDKPRRDDPAQSGRERKDRFGEGREPVADRRQQLALAEPVGQRAGENLDDRSRWLRRCLRSNRPRSSRRRAP